MVQNILVTGVTPLQNVDEINCWENRPFTSVWPESRRNKSTNIKKTIKKKPKRIRTAYTTEQLRCLEMLFTQNKYITSDRRQEISKALNIGDKSVKIWFQNRRMKEKRESSESCSDSSNETIGFETLPPPEPLTQSQNTDQVTSTVNQDANQSYTPESCQYQVPSFSVNNYYGVNEQVQTSHTPVDMPAPGMQFYNNNNVYPTQYYPHNDDNYINYYNYYQYQQENAIYNNYWNSNSVESCYFYN